MNSIKRLELIDKIASKLQQDYVTPDINIILGKFGIAANGSMPKSKKTYVKNLLSPTIDSTIINIASDLGFDVTEYQEDLIHNQTSEEINKAEYVNLGRILELKNVASPDFDLTILIKLCEELNDTYKNEHYYSTAMLVRAIIDHIPPIFGKGNFASVHAQYGTQSFKKQMELLDKSLRNIADSYLHTHIKSKEVLNNSTQVNFSQALDVLLGEVYRIASNNKNNSKP